MTALYFIPPRGAFTDPQTGELTRTAVLFFRGIFDRVGGTNGEDMGSLAALAQFDADGSAASGELAKQIDGLQQQVALLPDATAALAQLRRMLDDLRAALEELRDATDPVGDTGAAQQSELLKRCASLETLGVFG